MEWETDQDGDARRYGYAHMARTVRENATPDERVQRSIVTTLVAKFNQAIFEFEHGIGTVDADELALRASMIVASIRAAQEAAMPALVN